MSKRSRAQFERTDTVALPDGEVLLSVEEDDEVEEDVPPTKKTKVTHKREKIAYATTTVLRSLDEAGDQADATPLLNSLRSASFHTRKVLQKQLQQEKKKQTPEIIVSIKLFIFFHSKFNQIFLQLAKKVLGLLAKSFVEIDGYEYEIKSASHKWSNKTAIKEFQKYLTPLCEAATKILKVNIFF